MSHVLDEVAKFAVPIGAVIASCVAAGVAWFAATRAAQIAYSNKIAEFRQEWVNALRTDVAEYWAAAEAWARKRGELNGLTNADPSRERTELLPLEAAARTVLTRILLRINPGTDVARNPTTVGDVAFIDALRSLIDPASVGPTYPSPSWQARADDAVQRGRQLLKGEWETTKRFIPYQHSASRRR